MLNVITLFSGYDSQALALNRLGVDYELAAWCEIDKHAITAHNALFPQWADRNLGDVSKVDWQAFKAEHPEPIDLLTYSSPCQDFSNAGLQAGGDEGSGTRSGLLWEVEKAIAALKPRHLVFENVAALVSDKFIGVFNKWQSRLNSYGYTNFSQLMNAKDYGVPQNRLRIFMVSILDCERAYYFPRPFKLERRLKDVLEHNVDERYYLSDERVAKLMQETAIHSDRGNGFAFRPHTPEEIASTVKCSGIGDETDNFVVEPKVEIIADLQPDSQWQGSVRQQNQVVSIEGVAPACTAEHARHPYKIAEPQMLGWTRNEKGEITDRHPVNVANCVTAAKRDNTQNYVMEPTIYGLPHGHYEGDLYTDYAPTVKSSAYAANNPLIEPTIIDATNDFSEEEKRTYAEYSPALRSSRSGLMTTEGIRIRRLTERDNNNKNINNGQTRVFTEINEANTREALRLLRQEIGTQTFCEKMGRLDRFQQAQVLQQGMHEESVCQDGHNNAEQRHGAQLGTAHSVDRGEQGEGVRDMREERWQAGCTPQGRELEEQFLGEFNDCLSQLPSETPQAEECLRYLRQATSDWSWLLQQTLSTLEEVRQSADGERKNCQGIRIRRLSERELYRLMDLEEKDIDTLLAAPIPRTQHAKLAGNSIVVSCLYHIFRNLFVDIEPQAGTQTKLF